MYNNNSDENISNILSNHKNIQSYDNNTPQNKITINGKNKMFIAFQISKERKKSQHLNLNPSNLLTYKNFKKSNIFKSINEGFQNLRHDSINTINNKGNSNIRNNISCLEYKNNCKKQQKTQKKINNSSISKIINITNNINTNNRNNCIKNNQRNSAIDCINDYKNISSMNTSTYKSANKISIKKADKQLSRCISKMNLLSFVISKIKENKDYFKQLNNIKKNISNSKNNNLKEKKNSENKNKRKLNTDNNLNTIRVNEKLKTSKTQKNIKNLNKDTKNLKKTQNIQQKNNNNFDLFKSTDIIYNRKKTSDNNSFAKNILKNQNMSSYPKKSAKKNNNNKNIFTKFQNHSIQINIENNNQCRNITHKNHILTTSNINNSKTNAKNLKKVLSPKPKNYYSKDNNNIININSKNDIINKGRNNFSKINELYNQFSLSLRKNKNYTTFIKNELEKLNENNISNIKLNKKRKGNNQKNILNKYPFDINNKSKSNEKANSKKKYIEENEINENLSKNNLTMYTIYILSKYSEICDKIGLMKIRLFDNSNNEIKILFTNTNDERTPTNLFNLIYNSKNENKPFVSLFDYKNLYINFYIMNSFAKTLKYLKIINYCDIGQKISCVKEIEIYKKNILIYKGVLSNKNYDYENIIELNESNYSNNSKLLNSFCISNNKKEIFLNKSLSKDQKQFIGEFPFSHFATNKIDSLKSHSVNSVRKVKYFSSKRMEYNKKNINNCFTEKNIYKFHENTNFNNFVIHVEKKKSEEKYSNIIKSIIYFYKEGSHSNKLPNKTTSNYLNNYKSFINSQIYNNKKFIEFNKIKIILTENYHNSKYIGLTGIEFYNLENQIINIETAEAVGALPKDLRTIYNNENENRIFENVFNGNNNTDDIDNMWVTEFDKKKSNFPFIEIYFTKKTKVSKIKIYNYNDKKNLDICTKTIEIFLDEFYFATIDLNIGTGEIAYDFFNFNKNENDIEENQSKFEDFGQEIKFPIKNEKNRSEKIKAKIEYEKYKFSSIEYEQCYECPYLPYGNMFKIQLNSNYFKGIAHNGNSTSDLLKYNIIGLDKINIYNEKGEKEENYKLISNCEIIHYEENPNKILINGLQNENNSCLFFIFDKSIHISYIELFPLVIDKKCGYSELNSAKEIKIFNSEKIIFEGTLYLKNPSVVLFCSENKITKNININYLIKYVKNRNYKEEKKDDIFTLILD